jgi:serine/threonine protein kinase
MANGDGSGNPGATAARRRAGEGGDGIERLEIGELVRALSEAQRDRYRYEGVLATGGMGRIEAVVDRPLDRATVRKCIHDQLARSEQPARMFVREARVTGMLQHPGVVPVHDLGVDSEGYLYYTMERVEGRTLEEWLASLPPEPLDRSTLFDLLDVVVRVCDALSYAHSRGVLHCDIKPANVMVGDFGRTYLMDWGIARFIDDEERRTDGFGSPSGTPTHMAPEQARGDRFDVRTDVFAVGGLIYQIITRRSPYSSESLIHALAGAMLARYTHPDEVPLARGTPPALTRIVLEAMAPKREDRFSSVLELKDALVRFIRGVDVFPRITFAAGEDIVREGEPGDEAFVIERGTCEVHRNVDGHRKLIRIMEAGDVFGEMAILSPGPRTATVTAIEPTTLLRITSDALQSEMDSMKPWMGALVRTLAQRFRERESGNTR